MSWEPYGYAEDSVLLRDAARVFSGRRFLEIGAGNGGNLVELSGRFEEVVGTDLVKPSMEDWKGWADYLVADGAGCLTDGSFDLVAFNPPYLPEAGADGAVSGGRRLETPMRFLEEALRVVKADGRVLMLLNDRARIGEFERVCASHGFVLRKVAAKRVFFEELAVYEASRAWSQA